TAILAGDALQALAFETLAEAPNLPGEARLRAIALLAEAVGWRGMVGGQSFDLAAEDQALPLEHLEALHAAKTGALIRAAVQIGAVVGNPRLDGETFVLLGEFAARIGHAFQVIDDILNEEGDPSIMGKAAGTDRDRRKSTYPALLGLDAAKDHAARLIREAVEVIADFPPAADPLRAIADYVLRRRR
ncbi:MAG: polyprenyl synthetase family protein, partial [Desulfococcaceae bacterium]